MEDNEFLKEFSKILNPHGNWTGKGTNLKDIFQEKLKESKLSQYQAEKLLGVERKTLEGILNNTSKRVDVITLLKIGQFIGLDVNTVIGLFVNQISADNVGKYEESKKRSFIADNFDIKNLYTAKFIKSRVDFEKIEERIVKYFGLKDITDYSRSSYTPAFKKGKKAGNILMIEFFVRSAIEHFKKIGNPNTYNREALIELIPKIKPYTRNEEKGLKNITDALYNVGVTVIYQPHLPTTQIYGATFVWDNKPFIVLTDFHKKYPTLWFSLFHELHHVLWDFEDIKTQTYHLTGEQDLFLLQEDKADEFARDYLFSNERAKFIYPQIDNQFIIENYAEECHIHSSIIYSNYCYDTNKLKGESYWGKFHRHIPSSALSLNYLNSNPFEFESIEESVTHLKENVFNF